MICYNCGKKLDPDDKFCSECGVENLVTEEEIAIDNEISNETKKEKKPLTCPGKTAIVALVLSAAALQLPIVAGLVLGIIALVNSIRVRKECEDLTVRKIAKIAKLLSILAIVWSCVATVLLVLAVVVYFFTAVIYTVFSVLALIASLVFTDLGSIVSEFLLEIFSF